MMKILITLLSVVLLMCATSLEWAITGRAYWVPVVTGGFIVIAAGGWILWWISERFIDAIDFMTRWES
jgi:hypothetical protein